MNMFSEYDGHQAISLRDEPWGDAEPKIREAYASGYHSFIIDDSFIMMKESTEETEYVSSVEEMVRLAQEGWWGIE
jgi:hypothetical protein